MVELLYSVHFEGNSCNPSWLLPSSSRRNPVEISVVSPAYRCADCVGELHRQLVSTLENLVTSFEIVLVNDGCPANSWEAVRAVAARDSRVKAINLSRNFGQHYAIAAGVHHSCGNWVVVMDCDLRTARPKSQICIEKRSKVMTLYTLCARTARIAGQSVCCREGFR